MRITDLKIRLSFDGQVNAALNNEFPCYIFEMNDYIDVVSLREAVCFAIEEHPIFHTKLIKEKKVFYLIYNELKPRVENSLWDKKIKYGTKEWNYYPWIISVKDKKFLFTCAHAICDGTGAVEFLKTVLTRYLVIKGLISDKILDKQKKSEEDIESAIENSFDKNAGENVLSPYKRSEKKPCPIKKSSFYKGAMNKGIWQFKISQKEIQKLANGTETSTFAVIATILAQSLQNTCAIETGNIQIMLPVNLRRMYGSKTDMGFVHTASLNYNCEKCSGKSLELITTGFRSQLDLIIDKEYMDYVLFEDKKTTQLFLKHPIMMAFAKMAFYNMLYSPKASIVYTHLTSLGIDDELKPYIKDFYISGPSVFSPLIVAMASTYNDEISIGMGVSLKADYIKNMEAVLKKYDISYSLKQNEWLPEIFYLK